MRESPSSREDSAITLSRTLKPRHITMITLGGIIGAGLFVGSSVSIAAVGPAIVFSYIASGMLLLALMRMLGEMATALPHIQSFTEFARAGLGNGAGFVAGWLYWYFWIAVIPIELIAGAGLVHNWISLPIWQIGILLLTLVTLVNLLSTHTYGEFEFWFASIKVAAIVCFLAAASSYAFGLTAPAGATFSNLWSHGGVAPHGLFAVAAGVVAVFFSITGAEIATIAAAESKEPARAVAQMTGSVVSRILIFYVGSIFLIVCVVPWDMVRPGASPFTLALHEMHIPWASTAMDAIILTAVVSCLNSAFYICSRVLFVLAANNDAPPWLVRLNPRRVPSRTVMVGAFAGLLGLLANALLPRTVFAFLVNASGANILLVYMIITLAHIRLRIVRQRTGQTSPSIEMWWFPWASYAAFAGIAGVFVAMAFTPELVSQMFASIGMFVAVTAMYLTIRHRRKSAMVGKNRAYVTGEGPVPAPNDADSIKRLRDAEAI